MKYAELIKKLKRLDCEFKRQASGSHEIWHNPHTKRSTPIPHHAKKDMARVCWQKFSASWALIVKILTGCKLMWSSH